MSILSIFEKEKDEVSLLIDLGNRSITSSFVVFSRNNVPRFLYTTKSELSILDKPEASKIFEDMVNLLDEMLKIVTKQSFALPYWKGKDKKLAHVMISFSSPWFVSKTKHIVLSKEISFIISQTFLDDVVQKEEEIFKKELLNNKDFKSDSFDIVEKSIVHTKINGYRLRNSVGKKAKTFDAFLFMSVIDESILKKISNIILKHTHIPREKILMHTFPLVSFSAIRDIFIDNQDFLLLDVTGETTSLTLVIDDVITGVVTVPSGKNFIIREITKTFDVPEEIALSMFHLYISKKMNDSDVLRIEEILINTEKEWAIYLENALIDLSPEMILPSRVYITADSDVANLYMDFLKLPKTDATSVFRKNIDLVRINENVLKSFYKNESVNQVDEFIVLLATFYNKIMRNQ